MKEEDFQRQVIALAKLHGFRVSHFRPGRHASGRWATPVQGDGVGFPDLILVRGPRLLFVELKTDTGVLAPAQQAWLDALRAAGQMVAVWRPYNWAEIEATLKGEDGP